MQNSTNQISINLATTNNKNEFEKLYPFNKSYTQSSNQTGLLKITQIIGPIAFLLGIILLSYSNQTWLPIFVIPLVAAISWIVPYYFGRLEACTFFLSLSVITFISGIVQALSLNIHGELTSSSDAQLFFQLATEPWADLTLSRLSSFVDAPVPVMIWRYFYDVMDSFGIEKSIWIGTFFNSLVVSFSGVLTVATTRQLFPNDIKRITLVGLLFSFCGMFWLFGAIHIRDCFLLFYNSLATYFIVKALGKKPGAMSILGLIATLFLGIYCLQYFRAESVPIMYFTFLLALLAWTRSFCFSAIHSANLNDVLL